VAEERTKNANLKAVQTADSGPALASGDEDGKRERSTIEFPYNDLSNVVEIAKAIWNNAGSECSPDQLAGYLQVTLSGPVRGRFANSGTFGLTRSERGVIKLTELGKRIVDPKTEAAARVEAFLKVPLFVAIFDKYKGGLLPSAKGLENEMQALGVSSKQTDKARQSFMRSARQAGFFAHGEERLVRPAVGALPLATANVADPPKKNGDGNGGDPPSGLHPLIEVLVQVLPEPGSVWPHTARAKWIAALSKSFDSIYKSGG
jgi:hypothetical protein